jgi:hypothetical protein
MQIAKVKSQNLASSNIKITFIQNRNYFIFLKQPELLFAFQCCFVKIYSHLNQCPTPTPPPSWRGYSRIAFDYSKNILLYLLNKNLNFILTSDCPSISGGGVGVGQFAF